MSKRQAVALTAPGGKIAGRLVQAGGMLFSSSITGHDPQTGQSSDQPADQIATAFANLRRLLYLGQVSADALGLVTICLSDLRHAGAVDQAWRQMFPDGRGQPVRKVNEYDLPPGEFVQLQVTGATGVTRQPIELAGFGDGGPLGVRLGNLVFSAPIDGRDPATGRRSDERKVQMRQAFRNMDAFLAQAGGTTADLIHVFIFVRGREDQKDMLDAWLEAFPNDGDRPARKAIFDPTVGRDGKMIHLMCVAHLGPGQRRNLEVPGISKSHPNPMGCKIGNLVFSSGVGGTDPGGQETGKDAGTRMTLALRNARVLLAEAGGSLDDIGLIAITVNSYGDEPAILKAWRAVFPDPAHEPARHVMAFGGRGSYPVQLHVIAALGRS